jgi:hypothetical protein
MRESVVLGAYMENSVLIGPILAQIWRYLIESFFKIRNLGMGYNGVWTKLCVVNCLSSLLHWLSSLLHWLSSSSGRLLLLLM